MRTHILIALFALIVTACASKEHITQSQLEAQEHYEDTQVSFREGQASRVR